MKEYSECEDKSLKTRCNEMRIYKDCWKKGCVTADSACDLYINDIFLKFLKYKDWHMKSDKKIKDEVSQFCRSRGVYFGSVTSETQMKLMKNNNSLDYKSNQKWKCTLQFALHIDSYLKEMNENGLPKDQLLFLKEELQRRVNLTKQKDKNETCKITINK